MRDREESTMTNDIRHLTQADVLLTVARCPDELPDGLDVTSLSGFLSEAMKPYEDSQEDTLAGVERALGGGGFVVCATVRESLSGALVMLDTGMTGFIPPNLLLFVAVDPSLRGRGLGSMLIRKAAAEAKGGIKLHVEADNPARRLYARMGFEPSYIDMRWKR